MSDNTDNNKPENSQLPDDATKASSDLSAAAQEAIRRMQAEGKAVEPAKPKQSAEGVSSTSDAAKEPTVGNEDPTEPSRANIKEADDTTSKMAETTATEAVAEAVGNTTNDLAKEAVKALHQESERKREAEEKARDAVTERSTFTDTMRLKLSSAESADAIVIPVTGELIVGRADNVTDYLPEIDLTPHGAYRLGLSRRHAVILREEDRIVVKDLNSRNGTFVNGTIVAGGGTHVIRDGDELRFGNLAMHVSFESE